MTQGYVGQPFSSLGLLPNCWLKNEDVSSEFMLIPRVRKRRWSCLSGSEERGLLSGLGTGCPCLAHMALWIWFVFSFPFLSWLLLTLSLRLGLPRVPMTWPSKHSTLESPLSLLPLVCPSQSGLAVLSLGSDLLEPLLQPSLPWCPGSDRLTCWFLQPLSF